MNNAQVDVLEQELRQQEDYIYELEDYLLEYSDKLRDCRCSTPPGAIAGSASMTDSKNRKAKKSLRRPLAEPELADDTPAPELDETTTDGLDDLPTPAEELRESLPTPEPAVPEPAEEIVPEETNPAEMEIPNVEIGPTSSYRREPTQQVASSAAPQSDGLMIPDPADYQEAAPLAQATESEIEETLATEPIETPARMNAEQLEVRRVLVNDASEAESQGLLVVVEALNELREPVDVAGELSLMVLTPENDQPPQRVERWDFTPEEATAAWQSSPLGDGLHLELPLAKQNLPNRPLELWARLMTADGRKLITKLPFQPEQLATLSEAELQLVDDRASQEHFAEQDSRLFEASQGEARATGRVRQAVAEEAVVEGEVSRNDGWRGSTKAAAPRKVGGYASTKQRRQADWSAESSSGSEAPMAVGSVNPLRTAVRESRSSESPPTRWRPFE